MSVRNAGQVLMAIGVVCGLIYTLASLSLKMTSAGLLNGALLYVGIVTLLSGLILYGFGGTRRLSSGRKS